MTHNPIRPWRNIERRVSRQIKVGKVLVGGDAPISVQTMTNTLTTDIAATIEQIQRCAVAGADIVRVSTPDEDSTRALREIVRESPVPIVADIHFHYKRAIEAAEAGAACLRINPGNIGSADRVRDVIQAARDHGCSMRIGVNAGSLEKELLEKYCKKLGVDMPTDPNGWPTQGQSNPYYCAMVEMLDHYIGMLVRYLEKTEDPRNPAASLAAKLGQLDEDHIPEGVLGKPGDAHRGHVAIKANPLM